MSLEKLLIFGFALAAVFALATIGTSSATDRSGEGDGYRDKVTTMMETIP